MSASPFWHALNHAWIPEELCGKSWFGDFSGVWFMLWSVGNYCLSPAEFISLLTSKLLFLLIFNYNGETEWQPKIQNKRNTLQETYKLTCMSLSEISSWSPPTQPEFSVPRLAVCPCGTQTAINKLMNYRHSWSPFIMCIKCTCQYDLFNFNPFHHHGQDVRDIGDFRLGWNGLQCHH